MAIAKLWATPIAKNYSAINDNVKGEENISDVVTELA